MKTYYAVTSSFDDHGRTTAALTSVIEAESKPDDSFRSTARKDIYVDWYETREEAEEAVYEIRNA